MPDYFTHHIAAEKIYGAMDERYKKIIAENKTLYLLGAQGGDVFFFYGMSYKNNVGRILHRMNAAATRSTAPCTPLYMPGRNRTAARFCTRDTSATSGCT